MLIHDGVYSALVWLSVSQQGTMTLAVSLSARLMGLAVQYSTQVTVAFEAVVRVSERACVYVLVAGGRAVTASLLRLRRAPDLSLCLRLSGQAQPYSKALSCGESQQVQGEPSVRELACSYE